MEKNIRRAVIEDLPCIMGIYAYARKFMASHGNPRQWGPTNWPPESLIRQDIENGTCYVCETQSHVVGVFYYDYGKNVETGYLHIEGQWKKDTPYGVVHRIASDGSTKGVGTFCINWAYDKCHHLRMDTHPDNIVMQNLLTKLGFEKCGIIHVQEDNDPRYAYEKL
ncbi:MAG: GNAT family N-acetyltransferase [Chordicoccus sp.]